MKQFISIVILAITCTALQSCCGPSISSYQPVSDSKTISPFLVSEYAKAKKFKGNSVEGYAKKNTSLSLSKNTVHLREPFCITLLDLLGITTPGSQWKKKNTDLTEWFHAMGITLKPA